MAGPGRRSRPTSRIDGYGQGSYTWTPTGLQTTGPTAILRVSINGTPVSGESRPFAIYNGGTDYYVNDSSTARRHAHHRHRQ